MHPSEESRIRLIKMTNVNLMKNIWSGAAIFLFIMGLPFPIFWGLWGLLITVWFGVFGIFCFLIGQKFIPWVYGSANKGLVQYPVSEIKTPKAQLLQLAWTLNDNPESKIAVEVNGNWIDVTANWKNCFALSSGIKKNQRVYKKMIHIKDDYTYEELDYEGAADINIGLNRVAFHRQLQCGKLKSYSIDYNLGKNLDNNHVGVNIYRFSSAELTNDIHRWLAGHGYRLNE